MFSKKTTAAIQAVRDELVTLRTELSEQVAALNAEREMTKAVAERISSLEARVSGMGSELSRQLHELGNEIEELSRRADDTGIADIVDALKSAQVRLATEQARYEITFRQDLAELADKLLQRIR